MGVLEAAATQSRVSESWGYPRKGEWKLGVVGSCSPVLEDNKMVRSRNGCARSVHWCSGVHLSRAARMVSTVLACCPELLPQLWNSCSIAHTRLPPTASPAAAVQRVQEETPTWNMRCSLGGRSNLEKSDRRNSPGSLSACASGLNERTADSFTCSEMPPRSYVPMPVVSTSTLNECTCVVTEISHPSRSIASEAGEHVTSCNCVCLRRIGGSRRRLDGLWIMHHAR
jgi:hypothetical protein